jgi:DNA-binding NarL/FixJ family response regulator
MTNIILAEDHNIVRNGIKSLLEKESSFKITGEADNGQGVLDLLDKGTPADIVLADMNMAGMGGLELAERLHNQYPNCKIIILSALDNEKYVIKAFQAGVNGYLFKSAGSDELIFGIKHVRAGQLYVCSELTARFVNRLLAIPDHITAENIRDMEFSDREIEILCFISEGYTNQEIADKIFTSKRTVEGLRQALIDKTGSRNTAALVRFALTNGLIA